MRNDKAAGDWERVQQTVQAEDMSPSQQMQKLWKRIPKKYRKTAHEFSAIQAKLSFNSGYNDGIARQKQIQKESKEQLRVDLSISMQKLADSNAQLGTVLIRCIEKAL